MACKKGWLIINPRTPNVANWLDVDEAVQEVRAASAVEIKHYYALDFVRGIAAIAILFWHYQHFFMSDPGQEITAAERASSPAYWLFAPLYDYGHIAVQIFWILSGFVFSAVYFNRPANALTFARARFARLYPLHLLTLLVMCILQQASNSLVGHEQIYSNNDLRHFVLQIFLISHWGFENGTSFNGPIWSVSVEILVYIAFWLTLPLIRKDNLQWGLVLAIFCWTMSNILSPGSQLMWECGAYFFAGVAVFQGRSKFIKYRMISGGASLLCLVSGIIFLSQYSNVATILAIPMVALGTLGTALLFDLSKFQTALKPTNVFADLTYGIYLWHVPVQVALMIFIERSGAGQVVYSTVFLVAFFTLVLTLAALSFRFFESPIRRSFRGSDR